MAFRPLHDRVAVRRLESEEKSKGGIIIPDTAKEKPQEGVIVAVGPGGRDETGKLTPLDVKAGDKVSKGQPLLVLEAMKMEHTLAAPADGTVKSVRYAVGEQVVEGAELVEFEAG